MFTILDFDALHNKGLHVQIFQVVTKQVEGFLEPPSSFRH